jgi:integrase
MALTPFGIKNAQVREKPFKLSDGGGLYLLVQPNGSKLWRMKYHFVGKERLLSFGAYPSVGLADARAKRDQAKKLIATGTDPSVQKKLDRIAVETALNNTFGLIASEYLANMTANAAAAATIEKNRWLLEDLAAPIADRPIAEITPAELLDLLKRIEKSGRRESARRLRGVIGSVFRFAVVTLRANSDPTFVLRGALLRPKVQHRASIIEVTQLGALLRAIHEYDGWPTITAALKFVSLTMARPGEVRGMRRPEVDFEKAIWRIPGERTKMRRPHDVPLSRQAIEVLRDVWSISDNAELVFPSIRSNRRPLSENALNSALRRMGFTKEEMTAHGFRSTASTLLNERGFAPPAPLPFPDQSIAVR